MIRLIFLIPLFLQANIAPFGKKIVIKSKFAKNKDCIRCHTDIYEEFVSSKHFNSTLNKDKIHKIFYNNHPLKKTKGYFCAKCHNPTNDNKEAISCSFCHRIDGIKKAKFGLTYTISKEKLTYFSSKTYNQNSTFHKSKTNPIFKNSTICLTCHSPKDKKELVKKNSYIFCKKANITYDKSADCIKCHMPKVEGSLTDRFDSATHSFHGFSGLYNANELLKKYIKINYDGKKLVLQNDSTHNLILNPLREFVLKIDRKIYKIFTNKTNLKPKEKVIIKKDNVKNVEFGYYVINKKLAKQIKIDSKFIILKRIKFDR